MRALLDINVIIALFDPDHDFHERAHTWWASNSKQGWSSCPITENGVVRIMSNAAYSQKLRFTPSDLISRLKQFASQTDHEFWPDTLSLCDSDVFAHQRIHSSTQLTDIYLLAIATKRGARLITFDENIPLSPVRSAELANLLVI